MDDHFVLKIAYFRKPKTTYDAENTAGALEMFGFRRAGCEIPVSAVKA